MLFRESVAQVGEAPAEVADRLRAAVDLSRAAEALGQQQVAVLRALDMGLVTPAAATEITATRTGFTDAVVAFTTGAPAEWQPWWERATTGPDVLAAQQMQDVVGRAESGTVLRLDAGRWLEAMRVRISLIHQVEGQVDAAVLIDVGGLQGDAEQRAALVSGAVLLATALAIALAVGLGRPVVRDLGRLRDGARAVAYERLPQLVARLNRPGELPDLSVLDGEASRPSVRAGGRDEIGEVARAFDDVYRTAVQGAVGLAQSRLGVSRMFVTLARRMQRHVTLMTRQLDAVERDEGDSARLAWLYEMDHLVTLTRRSTDSLLVLGGQGPASVRMDSVAVFDLLRAAAGQIEAYRRIAVRVVDPDLAVTGQAAEELALLLAELMDNAAALSRDQVAVDARRLADRLVIQVVDSGIGIEEPRRRQLNERLAAIPVVDVDSVQQRGLTVVGLIAANYGLRVQLLAGQPSGTIAEVSIPTSLLRPLPPPPSALTDEDEPTADRPHGPRMALPTSVPAPPLPLEAAPGATLDPAVAAEKTTELPIYSEARAAALQSSGFGADAGGSSGLPMPAVAGMTVHGLPIRRRQRDGAAGPPAETDSEAAPYRDPSEVAAAMTAYARGVSRSRDRRTAPAAFPSNDRREI